MADNAELKIVIVEEPAGTTGAPGATAAAGSAGASSPSLPPPVPYLPTLPTPSMSPASGGTSPQSVTPPTGGGAAPALPSATTLPPAVGVASSLPPTPAPTPAAAVGGLPAASSPPVDVEKFKPSAYPQGRPQEVPIVNQLLQGPAASLAGNDNLVALGQTAGVAVSALEKLAPAGSAVVEVFGGVVGGAVALVGAFGSAVQAFVNRGKELAPFSGELTEAGVKAEQRSFQADIKEAETLGPALAELTDAQSEFQSELREILLPIKKWLVETFAEIMKAISQSVRTLPAAFAAIQAGMAALGDAIVKAVSLKFGQAGDAITALPGKMREAFLNAMRDRDREKESFQMFGERQLDQLGRQDFDPRNFNAIRPVVQQNPQPIGGAAPIFGGL